MDPKVVQKFFADGGDDVWRYKYDLNENSIVFDLGGYQGSFAENIYNKFKSTVHIFEPAHDYYHRIVRKFKENDKIHVHHFGISNENTELTLYKSHDATSIFRNNKTYDEEVCKFVKFEDFMNTVSIDTVDLIKLNIEGSEFDVLPDIINSDWIKKIHNIQVQFHNMDEDSVSKRNNILENLSKTHKCDWCYEFVWESWSLC